MVTRKGKKAKSQHPLAVNRMQQSKLESIVSASDVFFSDRVKTLEFHTQALPEGSCVPFLASEFSGTA